jgi:hypothetical protein
VDLEKIRQEAVGMFNAMEGVEYADVRVVVILQSHVVVACEEDRIKVYVTEKAVMEKFPDVLFDFHVSTGLRCCDRDEAGEHLLGCSEKRDDGQPAATNP